jgi:hypothetical protein
VIRNDPFDLGAATERIGEISLQRDMNFCHVFFGGKRVELGAQFDNAAFLFTQTLIVLIEFLFVVHDATPGEELSE